MKKDMTFEGLVNQTRYIHEATSTRAKSAVNQMLTARNWAIGYYIVEYEQQGRDRAEYGVHLLENLAKTLNIKGLERLQLNYCRTFYQKYPQICSTVSNKLKGISGVELLPNLLPENETNKRSADSEICSTPSNKFETPPEMLISRLSFSHIREILAIDDPFERFFYEFECIKGTWSVRELRRQIATNLFFRAGVSKKPEQLLKEINSVDHSANLAIREPFVFEFLGLDAKDAFEEDDLERALMDHLQEFLLEMGEGFCFEAKQKRILIDDNYYFPDLVLYNRILHCSVIVELKNDEFSHEHFGQLNAYVAYFKENEMHSGDNPPVGILLCTKKGKKMVEYALSGMDNQLFASTYMLHLPDKKQLEGFLLREMKELGG